MNDYLHKCYKSFYGVKCNNPRDFVRLFHDEGRRQYDIQAHVSKIDTILSTSNQGAAGKFYTVDYVLVPTDQLILRANITKLSKLLENISDMDRSIKAHLNTFFQSKTGKLMRGEEYSKSFDEEVTTRLNEAKEKVNSESKCLNDKRDQCKDIFRSVLLLKNKSKKDQGNRTKGRAKKESNREKLMILYFFIDWNEYLASTNQQLSPRFP